MIRNLHNYFVKLDPSAKHWLSGCYTNLTSGDLIRFVKCSKEIEPTKLTMRIVLYIIGALILLGAACFAATLVGIPPLWVGIIGAVILGVGIMGAANAGKGTRTDGNSTVINKID